MEQSLVFTFLFAATAPLALMPAIICLFTKHEKRIAVAVANFGLWAIAYLAVRSFIVPGHSFIVPAPLVAIGWVSLLAYVIRSSRSSSAPAIRLDDNRA